MAALQPIVATNPTGSSNFDVSQNSNYQQILNILDQQLGRGATAQNASDFTSQVNSMGNTFDNLFTTLVGRAPTADEQNQFITQYIQPNIDKLRNPATDMAQDPYTYITQFVNTAFQPQAKDYATQQLQNQQSQAQSLANQYLQNGQNALNSTSSMLQDYQTQLWNRLQPQILTSLQAQGLLNTGGLNEALAGAQKDLAAQTQGYLADANLQMQNQANQIAFGGQAAPYYYQQGNIMNQLPYMQSMGTTAMNQGYNTFLNNLQYQNQAALQNGYLSTMLNNQPSMLGTLGSSFASSFGQSAGKMATQLPFAAMSSFGGPGMSSMGSSMMG